MIQNFVLFVFFVAIFHIVTSYECCWIEINANKETR